MAKARVERRLAAILAADVVGYSRLVEQDEASTLAAIKDLREQAIDPLLAEHKGRIVKLMGDGAIMEFASVVDAVACAVAVQKAVADRQARSPPGRRIVFRIGVNLGDLVVEGDDLLGDGVNVAARLEQLCEPGGVLVSGTAYDHLQGKPGMPLQFAGEQRVKNIARPIRTYRLVAHGTAGAMPAQKTDLPSIAVLPFDNLSGDPAQTYFSDGFTEDLITELSRFRTLVVLARHSSFSLRGQRHDAIEVGRRLGVSYLLEGSVRRAGERVRITAQLIDAATGAHLWADRYDRSLDDIFAVQDEVVATIAATLAGRIQAAGIERAKRKPTDELAAYDCLLRGQERLAAYGAEANAAARGYFERAAALDPDYALAHAFLALAIFNEPWGDATAERLATCVDLAQRAVRLDSVDSRCHRVLAMILLTAREFDRAGYHADRSTVLNPNDADAAAYRSYILTFLGQPEEALAEARRALALNPFHPGWYWTVLARALHAAGRHAEAIAAFERIERLNFHHHARLAASHAALGHAAEACHCVERALAAKPDFSSAAWIGSMPYRRTADSQHLLAELLTAGLPP